MLTVYMTGERSEGEPRGRGSYAARRVPARAFGSDRHPRRLRHQPTRRLRGVVHGASAKVLAETLGRHLLRLQCYEGLDLSSAVHQWNTPRQMVGIRLSEAAGERDRDTLAADIFTERFLIERPLLKAPKPEIEGAPVLLIDLLDRADEAFEAFLLEVLSDYQITVPDLGTFKAPEPPIVIITSNRTREIHNALKRRCFYHWLDYPDAERELEILRVKAPEAPARLSSQVVAFVQELRQADLFKLPGVAETIDWVKAPPNSTRSRWTSG